MATYPSNPSLLAEDNGPKTLAVGWTLCSVAGIILGLRIYAKSSRHHGLWWDDYFLFASWITIIIYMGIITRMRDLGLGKHHYFDPSTLDELSLLGIISTLFSICSVAWSKTSFAITLLRLTDGWIKRFAWFVIITINTFLGLAALLHWVGCQPLQKAWRPFTPGTCWPAYVSLYVDIACNAYSATMDILLSLTPWFIVKNIQIRLKEKIGLAVAMSMGVFSGITAVVKVFYLTTMLDEDVSFKITYLVMWGAAEVCGTIIASSIPVLRVFLRNMITSKAGSDGTEGRSSHMASKKSEVRQHTEHGIVHPHDALQRSTSSLTHIPQYEMI